MNAEVVMKVKIQSLKIAIIGVEMKSNNEKFAKESIIIFS